MLTVDKQMKLINRQQLIGTTITNNKYASIYT